MTEFTAERAANITHAALDLINRASQSEASGKLRMSIYDLTGTLKGIPEALATGTIHNMRHQNNLQSALIIMERSCWKKIPGGARKGDQPESAGFALDRKDKETGDPIIDMTKTLQRGVMASGVLIIMAIIAINFW